jgi:predicted ArsR family transcriptional regulator
MADSKYTDENLIKALNECMKRATVPASEVAKVLEGNAEYVKNKLRDLKKRGLIEGEIVSGMWCFRPKTE